MIHRTLWRTAAIAALLALLFSGCRIRVVTEKDNADEVQVITEPVVTQNTEPTDTTEAGETEPTEPPVTPEQTAPLLPEETEPPETAAGTEPQAPRTGSGSGGQQAPSLPGSSAGTGTGPALPATEQTEPETTAAASARTTVTVYLDPNGGEGTVSFFSATPGDIYGSLPEASWRGHVFNGWWTSAEGGQRVFSDTVVTAAEDHTLFAHWSETKRFQIWFNGNGGRVKPKDERIELRPGESFGPLPVPIWEGYDFLGWFTDPTNGTQVFEDTLFESASDLSLYAHWQFNAVSYWTFVLQNKTQQIYLCQQTPIYFEKTEDHLTQASVALIDDTGSYNIAQYLSDPVTTDDWVTAKNPTAVIKCVSSMAQAETVRAELNQRFPGKQVYLVTEEALGTSRSGLYARLYIAKALYGDWYTDVDLTIAARDLGIESSPVR